MRKTLIIVLLTMAAALQAADQSQYIYPGGLDHPIQHWLFPDVIVLSGTTGFFAQDVNKIAFQDNNGAYWYLVDPGIGTSPVWSWFAGGPFHYNGSGNMSLQAPLQVSIPGNASASIVGADGGFRTNTGPGVNGKFLEALGPNSYTDSTWMLPTTGGTAGQSMVSAGTTAQATWSDASRTQSLAAYRALGSVMQAFAPGGGPDLINGGFGLTTGEIRWVPVWVDSAMTVTGVKFLQWTAGVYTATTTNRIGLYSYSGGTLTQRAATADSAATWTGASNTWVTKAFTATYAATPGLYFVAYIYRNTAQTTQPQIGALPVGSQNAWSSADLTNSAKLYGFQTGQTDLPATQLMSGIGTMGDRPFMALY